MTDEQRKRIYDALLGEIPAILPVGDPARVRLEKLTYEEVNKLEPIIDDIITKSDNDRQRPQTFEEAKLAYVGVFGGSGIHAWESGWQARDAFGNFGIQQPGGTQDPGGTTGANRPMPNAHIRIRYSVQGGHVHTSWWGARFSNATHGRNGELVFTLDEWELLKEILHDARIELIDEPTNFRRAGETSAT